MKKVLIVDDDNFKNENIKELLLKVTNEVDVTIERALNSGLRRIYEETFSLIILDMSLPIFSLSETKNFDFFGGITFLKEMKRKQILTPTVVVTQYEIIGEGDSKKTSEAIDIICQENFQNYFGLIVYSSINNNWKEKLVKKVGEILNG